MLELPAVYCPLDGARHPEVSSVQRRAVEWLDQAGFCRDPAARTTALASSSADFYARFAPHAHVEGLLTAVLWVYWGFAFDDACCDEGELSADPAAFASLAGRVQRSLETPHDTDSIDSEDPFAAAVADIGSRFRATGSAVQVRRFVDAHRAWLFGVLWQIGNRARDHLPGLDEYLTMRLHSAGGEPAFAMLELANGLDDIPEREMDSPRVRALTEMAIAVAALDNDRVSHAKEAGRGQTDQNIFTVLRHQEKCGPREAVELAVSLRDRILDRFLQVREHATRTASEPLRRYLADLGHGIRGNIEWGAHVARYRDPAPLTWTEKPLVSSWTAIPPSIAWWWDR
ncbi:terpene synthase family protein [Allokutzneria sp. A3M-2-11 16]|uniref:terpene synthase family protein n=1 Tax=Allokutzneria sp. A3M-2-11 16 TaxID=2962043 RepID=UPI0020B6B586|nr:terpene synthase family protein [Allokutzneria sp. A3M-2-11 16]MCP3802949.1 terpene synthase family protein [Allokutzneria sp. A3M-2-11 16]